MPRSAEVAYCVLPLAAFPLAVPFSALFALEALNLAISLTTAASTRARSSGRYPNEKRS